MTGKPVSCLSLRVVTDGNDRIGKIAITSAFFGSKGGK